VVFASSSATRRNDYFNRFIGKGLGEQGVAERYHENSKELQHQFHVFPPGQFRYYVPYNLRQFKTFTV
jgi:hypothetical protein